MSLESMWREIPLELTFTVPLCGGVPRDDSLVKTWLEVRQPSPTQLDIMKADGVGPDERKPREMDEVEAEQKAHIEAAEAEARVWVGFNRDDEGLFIRGANLRAHFKDGAQVCAAEMKKEGGYLGLPQCTAFRKKLIDRLYIKDERMRILIPVLSAGGKDDTLVVCKEPTGARDASLSVMTPQGPRTCLKRVDYIERATIRCTVQLMQGGPISRDHIEMLLQYGCVHGLGQDRSLQYGRYTYKLGE